jgi:outer membrane receptor protein involved in Fe transport
LRTGLILFAFAAAAPSTALAQAASSPKPPPEKSVSEVVITAQAPAVQTSVDRRSYNVANDLQATTGSIGDALRNVPSVQVDVQGNVTLRGDANVTILIDGKPSSLFQGDNAGQALQQLPADRIARVEVLTNPSAEFRADGTAGIINLVTKTSSGAGRTGSARLTGGDGDRVQASVSAGFNSKDLSISADAGWRHDTGKQEIREDRIDTQAGYDHALQTGTNHIALDNATARLGLDYDLDPSTRIGAELRANYTDFNLDGFSRQDRRDLAGGLTQAFDRDLGIDQQRANGQATLKLRRKLDGDGHEVSLNLSYEATRDDRVRSGETVGLVPAFAPAFDQQRINNDLARTDLKGDYVRPLGAGVTLKAGFDLQYDDNSYGNRGFRGPAPEALTPDPSLTNLFLYRQRLAQAYVTYERPFGDLTVLAGLRLEDVRIDLDQVTQGRKDVNAYARAYPSLHLSWPLADDQKLTASYSQRVQRPQPEDFNAFRFLLDPLNYKAGNPRLQPQQTQSFELGYEYRKSPVMLLATAYFRQNDHVVTDVVRDLGGGVFLTTRENVSSTRSGGLELVANGRLARDLTYSLSGNLFWNQLDAQALGFADRRSAVSAFGRASLSWQATDADFIQISTFLNGKRLTPQGYYAPSTGTDLGWRHKIDDRISLVLTARDILGTYRDKQIIDTPGLRSTYRREPDSRAFMIGFSWTLGGGKARDPGFDFSNGSGPPPQ